MKKSSFVLLILIFLANVHFVRAEKPLEAFEVLVLTERGGHHKDFTTAGLIWLNEKAKKMNFKITEINNTRPISDEFLNRFRLIIQLDYVPYTWKKTQEDAFVRYIEDGKGGWIGFHHAALLGDFDGYPMWQWFSDFLGSVKFKNYIAETASANVKVEDKRHPVMKNVNPSFIIPNDEWYTFDKSPRSNVHVLAHVDESSYQPASTIKMGDHPAVWVNQHVKARNVYFLMGHSPLLFNSADFKRMFSNAIVWASNK